MLWTFHSKNEGLVNWLFRKGGPAAELTWVLCPLDLALFAKTFFVVLRQTTS